MPARLLDTPGFATPFATVTGRRCVRSGPPLAIMSLIVRFSTPTDWPDPSNPKVAADVGDLTAAGAQPVTPAKPGKVVYSMHDYAWYHPSGQSQADYITSMNAKGGYLMTQGKAPVWVSEFGVNGARGRGRGPSCSSGGHHRA